MTQTTLNEKDWLCIEFDILSKNNVFEKEIPRHITENLHWELRPYQVEVFGEGFSKNLIEIPLFREEIREFVKLKEFGKYLIK